MPLNRGDVALVPVPDTSGKPGKARPVLVVSADQNNQRLQDVIVAAITSTTIRAKLEPTQLLIEVSTPEGIQSGLTERFRSQSCLRSHLRQLILEKAAIAVA